MGQCGKGEEIWVWSPKLRCKSKKGKKKKRQNNLYANHAYAMISPMINLKEQEKKPGEYIPTNNNIQEREKKQNL